MKIAYITTYDSSDILKWSGLGTFIRKALHDSGFEINTIGNLKSKSYLYYRIKRKYYSRVLKTHYLINREPAILQHYAKQIESDLINDNSNIIFSPGTIPIAYLQTKKPLIFWTDATFAGMLDFYPDYKNLSRESINNGNKIEQLALHKCHLALYASEWAAKTAVEYYKVDPQKVKVVPFGPNIECNRTKEDIEEIMKEKNFETCKLLFVGVDWQRKGGDIAVEVAKLLNQRDVRTELHIVGCNPRSGLPKFVKQHGFLSKKTETDRNAFDTLFSQAHFLIMPTRAECYGVVFPEASSYGLPSLATKVGGIPTAIKDGKNGQTFSLGAEPQAYCNFIENYFTDKEKYFSLAITTFNEYTTRLNWRAAGKNVHQLIHEHCTINKQSDLVCKP